MKLFVYGTLQRKVFKESMLDMLGSNFIRETRTINKYPMFINDMNVPVLCDRSNIGNIIEGELWEVQDIVGVFELERGYFLTEIETEEGEVWTFMKHCSYLYDKTLISCYDEYSAPDAPDAPNAPKELETNIDSINITHTKREYYNMLDFKGFREEKELLEFYTLDEDLLKDYNALKGMDFCVGAEFEFYLNDMNDVDELSKDLRIINNANVRIDLSGDETKNTNGVNWFICRDKSLTKKQNGIEISTPKVKFKVLYKIIINMFKLINKYGFTDKNTALHIHASSDYMNSNLNIPKLIILSNLDGMFSWNIRSHSQSVFTILAKTKTEQLEYLDELLSRRYQLNFIDKNRIEYRAIGGNYTDDISKIKKVFISFLSNIKYSMNTEDRQKEYEDVMNNEIIPFLGKKDLVNLETVANLAKINLSDKNKHFII